LQWDLWKDFRDLLVKYQIDPWELNTAYSEEEFDVLVYRDWKKNIMRDPETNRFFARMLSKYAHLWKTNVKLEGRTPVPFEMKDDSCGQLWWCFREGRAAPTDAYEEVAQSFD
jgi:hypothetical protein